VSASALPVAFFVPSFPELTETFLLRQVTGLLDRGCDVRVLAHESASSEICHPDVLGRNLAARTRYLARGEPSSLASGGTATERPQRPALRRVAAALRDAWTFAPRSAVADAPSAVYRVARVSREPRPKIVHCHYGDTGLQYGFAATLWNVPLIVSFYGYDVSSFPRTHGNDVYRALFRRADRVLALSEEMREVLCGLGAPRERTRLQHLSVDPVRFGPPPEGRVATPGPVRILTVGRLVEKKGHEYALKALATLSHDSPGFEYEVVGDGPLASHLQSLAESLGIADRVRFRGALSEPEVADAMRRADLFVLPSVEAANGDREGTPTVLLEAQATSLPVIATRHAGIPEVVRDGETAILVGERDVEGLARALRTMLASPETRLAFSQAGRDFVLRRHSVEAGARQLEQIYEEVLNEREGGE